MEELLDLVAAALADVRATVVGRDAAALSPRDLISASEAFGRLQRAVDAARLPVVTEVARQSRAELGRESLAKRQGFRSPAALISATTGSSAGEAARLIAVGEATATRMTLTGELLPAKHPSVAEAVRAGRIGMAAAATIVAMLDRVALRADPDGWAAMEARLAGAAAGLTLRSWCSGPRRSWIRTASSRERTRCGRPVRSRFVRTAPVRSCSPVVPTPRRPRRSSRRWRASWAG